MNLGKETETLEFKKSTGELKEAVISIAAILNKYQVTTYRIAYRIAYRIMDVTMPCKLLVQAVKRLRKKY